MYDLRQKALLRFNSGIRKPLLTKGNPKTDKSIKFGYLTAILHLSPADLVAKKTLCPFASAGCKAACLNTAGRGALHMMMKGDAHLVQDARALRTVWWEQERDTFLLQLEKEITNFIKYAKSKDLKPCIRLNGTSDILWERHNIIQKFPKVQFYDYTKIPKRKNLPKNYHLTFSAVEDNDVFSAQQLDDGMNVAAVFHKLPAEWLGYPVMDGDESDLRFLDPEGHVVGLKSKGQAKHDTSGFVKDYTKPVPETKAA